MRLRPTGLAILSGVLLAISFPKYGHWSFAWVSLTPLLLALLEESGKDALRLGYFTGCFSALGILYWTSLVVTEYGGLSLGVGLLVMAALSLAVALFPALFAVSMGVLIRRLGPLAILLAPFVWVGTELLRNRTFFRFPWCLLGYSQAENLPFIQVARFGGVYAVSFVVVSAGAGLALLGAASLRRRSHLALLPALLLVLVFADGLRQLWTPSKEEGRVRVGLVQARILQEEKWAESRALDNMEEHAKLTRVAAKEGASLVVWPESSVPYLYDETPFIQERLKRLAREEHVSLLFGNDDREDGGPGQEPRYFVGAKLLTEEGVLEYRYHKIHLVPFGEYVPMQPLFTLGGRYAAKLVQQIADFTPGDTFSIATVAGHRLGAFICYEDIFPEIARGFSERGAELLVNITNDAWYGRSSAPYQHLGMAVFRSVEDGKYMVRAANTGITAVIDPRGRVLERTALFERICLVRDVPFVPGTTFYVRHGDLFAWFCLLLTVALLVVSWGWRRRARRHDFSGA